jgi:selenocysteine lyase/cysteine desulfurase
MDLDLIAREFPLETVYLNTASQGVLPHRTRAALHDAVEDFGTGRATFAPYEELAARARAAYGRIAGARADRVALGTSVTVHVGMIATALPPGAEVLCAEQEFSAVVAPFAARPDLRVRIVPLEELAAEVRPSTALVAVALVQSVDGRIADLPALRAATRAHGARLLIDTSQAAGWLPLDADDADYVVCGAFKWLAAPRGVSFLTVREGAEDGVSPCFVGWFAAEDPATATYGPVTEVAKSARRFDVLPPFLPYAGAAHSLELLASLDLAEIHAHDLGLAARFRAGLERVGIAPLPDTSAGRSAIVALPGLGHAAGRVAEAGIQGAERGGNLRFSFHLYNTGAEVDRLLDALAG